MIRHLTLVSLVLGLVLAQAPAPRAAQEAAGQLGVIDFPTSQTGAAQDAFVRGVLLLHSFEYEDAREAFQEAQQAAPGFAMAYWGEAMSYNHPLWAQTAPEQARAALERLAPTPSERLPKAGSDKERDWLRAVDALFGTGEKLERDKAYAAAMAHMHEAYPDDLEVTAFYALALLGTSHGGRDFGIYMRAAALAEDVYASNPKHPGAVHYLIHAFDDPVHAPLGLRYAVAYGRIAPSASHALHMPSHIYFALGMWDEASETNERSVKAADDRVAQKNLGVDDRGFHALLWLTYSYLQQGRQQEARGLLDQIEDAAAKSGSARTRSHLALARATWLIETRRWNDAKAPVNPEELSPDAAAADIFASGLASFRSGNRMRGHEALKLIAQIVGDGDQPLRSVTTARPPASRPATPSRPGVRPIEPATPPTPSGAPAAPGTDAGHAGSPSQPPGLPSAGGGDKRVAAVMAQQLEAVLLFVEGRRDEGIVLARQAAAVEDSLSFEFGPPVPVKPGHELVGDLLMDVRRPAEAISEYEAALQRTPRRTQALLGLYRAATASRDTERAQRAAAELRKVWHRADKTLPDLREIAKAPTSF